MKNWILAIVILVVGLGIIAEFRYTITVDSPIVAKLDRLTGDAWIVNSGVWIKVQPSVDEKAIASESTVKSAK